MSRHAPWRRLSILVAAAVLLPVAARSSAQTPASVARLELLDQPPWHAPGDPLGLRLRVHNDGNDTLSGFRIRVGAYDRVGSRSELHASFVASPFYEPSSFPADFPVSIAPGGSRDVTVDASVDELTTLRFAPEGGVFPVTLTLQDEAGLAVLDSTATPLLYFPQAPETPLNVVLVVPLMHVPARGPGGFYETADAGGATLERGVAEDGWLRGMVDAISRWARPPEPTPGAGPPKGARGRTRGRRERPRPEPVPPLRVAVAPAGRLVEELADMANGYVRAEGEELQTVGADSAEAEAAAGVLASLEAVLSLPGVDPLLSPYAFPDLPTLSLEDAAAHLDEAEAVLRENLPESRFSRAWLYPPGGRLDARSLPALRSLQAARHTFFSETSLEEPDPAGCPEAFASFTCPVAVETLGATASGYVADSALQARLAELARDDAPHVVSLQRLLAETVQMWAEIPGTESRVALALTATRWEPEPWLSERFFSAFARAPWLRTVPPDEALEEIDARERALVATAPPAPGDPGDDYRARIAAAADLLASLGTVATAAADDDMLRRLRTNLLVAQSRAWWEPELAEQRERYVSETVDEVEQQFQNIKVGGADEINLTSQRAPVQLLLFNDNSYPVTLEVHLDARGELDLSETSLRQTVPPGKTRQIQIEAVAETSGIFPLDVVVQAPDGHPIAEKSIRIRSTNFNKVALALTVGALAFLVLFYLFRAFRRQPVASRESAGAQSG